jgi:drug/metabolite transporter (DMT)-like permease/GNAT superfamily N-acetyltransferase
MKRTQISRSAVAIQLIRLTRAEKDETSELFAQVFAGSPWFEIKRCRNCGERYGGGDDLERFHDGDLCRNCGQPLDLVDFWGEGRALEVYEDALKQPGFIGIGARNDEGRMIGFSWGFAVPHTDTPSVHFSTISGLLARSGLDPARTFYAAETGVAPEYQKHGVGSRMSYARLREARDAGFAHVCFRTINPGLVRVYERFFGNQHVQPIFNDPVETERTWYACPFAQLMKIPELAQPMSTPRSAQWLAWVAAVVTIIIWSTLTVVGKLAVGRLPSAQALVYTLSASLVTLAVINAVGTPVHRVLRGRTAAPARPSFTSWLARALLGVLSPFGYYALILSSLERSTASQTQLLSAWWPLFFIVTSLLLFALARRRSNRGFGERPTRPLGWTGPLGLLIALVGFGIILIGGRGTSLQEVLDNLGAVSLIPLAAGALFGLFSALVQQFKQPPYVIGMLLGSSVACLIAIALAWSANQLPDLASLDLISHYLYLGIEGIS